MLLTSLDRDESQKITRAWEIKISISSNCEMAHNKADKAIFIIG